MRKFLVYSPAYSEQYGGIISLHKLCDLINRIGGEAYLHPFFDLVEVNALNAHLVAEYAEGQRQAYRTEIVEKRYAVREDLITPVRHVLDDEYYGDDWIVVYPELVLGNPLRAPNVVRWLMHNPGFHSGRIGFGPGELHIRFAPYFDEFHFPRCRLSENFLTVVDFNFGIYNTDGVAAVRSGTAYALRKARGRPTLHDLTDSTLIDNLSQAEIAALFKTVTTFYSYETHSAFSQLAAVCGCDSVVIPREGVPESEWMPDESSRYGVAYGVENIEKARATAHLAKPHLETIQRRSVEHVIAFLDEADAFFSERGR